MRILAFESSAKAASVALLEDDRLLGEYYQNSGQTHSRTLMQMAENLLKNCDLTPADIDAAAVAAGPGSFTGVRIGVAAAKGFAWGREVPCYGVSTLEAMAMTARHLDGILCCAMDARRAQVYNAVFRAADGALERLSDDRAISLQELGEELKKYENPIFLVGDGAALCYNTLCQTMENLRLLPEEHRMQRASGAALLALERVRCGDPGAAAALTPQYLRLSQAERERQERLRQGKD